MATTHSKNSADRHAKEHVHGTMDVTAHEKTFNGFIRLATWSVVSIAAILVFLALANA